MELQIISDYLDGESAIKVALKHGIPARKVYYILERKGVARRSNKDNSRRYKVNHDYFESIEEQSQAYWLGFLFADGHVCRNTVAVSQKIPDDVHLNGLIEDLESDYVVKRYQGVTSYGNCEYGRLLVTSTKMSSDLKLHGMVERKSLVLQPPQILEHLRGHFIRGYFDGDGSASGSPTIKIRFLGTREMLEWISEELGATKAYWSKRHDDGKNNFQIELSRQQDIRVATDLMYDSATRFLRRKYNRLSKFHSRPIQ